MQRLLRVAVAIAGGVVLGGAGTRDAGAPRSVLELVWVLAILALSSAGRVKSACFGSAGLAVIGAWSVHPACWVFGLGILGVALLVDRSAGGAETEATPPWVPVAAALLAALGPGLLTLALLAAGGPGASVLRQQLSSAIPGGALGVSRFAAEALTVWATCWLAAGTRLTSPTIGRAASVTTAVGLALLVAVRGQWMASVLRFPTEMQWSEPPHLLNLWKLELGEPIYGSPADCNSYSYSPLLELVHRSLLSPLGLELSLVANRSLNLIWHALAIAILAWTLRPSERSEQAATDRVIRTLALVLAITSSFLAANLHPDHLTMLGFSAALALIVAEPRLPGWLFAAGLLLVPAFCTMAKLTGAGVGLGLVLAFLLPPRKRPLLLLGAAGLLAILTIPLFDATLGPFSEYAIRLQASHQIRWKNFPGALASQEARAFWAALLAVLILRRATQGAAITPASTALSTATSDAARMLIATAGFALPSFVAYLKVGGRANSLLPLTIGAVAALVRLAPAVDGARALVVFPALLALLLRVAPPEVAVSRAQHDAALVREKRTEALLRGEVTAGRATLAYGTPLSWIAAGPRTVPLDQWQTLEEYGLGGWPEAARFHERLRSGHYQSVIAGTHALSPEYSSGQDTLATLLSEYFVRVTPANPSDDEGTPVLFRYRGPARR